jgi:hypothetical protein
MIKEVGEFLEIPYIINMKNIKLLFLLIFLSNNIGALENINIYMGLGNFCYDKNTTFNIDLFSFGMEQKKTGIGFEFSFPRFWRVNEDKENVGISIFNQKIYWDFLFFYKSKPNTNEIPILIGPYCKINYIFIGKDKFANWNEYVFSTGLNISIFTGENSWFFYLLNGEVGYQNYHGEHAFYASININVLGFIFIKLKY